MIVHDRTHPGGHLRSNSFALRALLRRTGQQVDDFILRMVGFAGGREHELVQGLVACIEELSRRANLVERIDDFLPGRIELRLRDLSLTGQNLPEPEIRLKDSQGISAQLLVGNSIEYSGDVDKPGNGSVVQFRELGKNWIPTAELRDRYAPSEASSRGTCFSAQTVRRPLRSK